MLGADRSPNRGLMEVPGEALRIASLLRQVMADIPPCVSSCCIMSML